MQILDGDGEGDPAGESSLLGLPSDTAAPESDGIQGLLVAADLSVVLVLAGLAAPGLLVRWAWEPAFTALLDHVLSKSSGSRRGKVCHICCHWIEA